MENMARIGDLEPEIDAFHWREPWEYRCRVKLKSTDEGRIGFIRKGTNRVMPVTGCRVMEHGIRDFVDRWNRLSQPPFFHQMDGFSYQDRLYIYLSHAPDSRSREILQEFSRDQSVKFSWRGKWKESVFRMTLREFEYLVSPSVFFQVNRRMWSPMLDTVEGMLTPGRKMIDLYAGVGFFTPLLKKYASTVTAVESGPAATLAGRMMGAGSVHRISAEAFRYPPADLILVDPPRSGLSSRVIQSIAGRAYPHIIYVSCSPSTLARDCRILVEKGGYRLQRVELLDLFPQTPHLESVVHLVRT